MPPAVIKAREAIIFSRSVSSSRRSSSYRCSVLHIWGAPLALGVSPTLHVLQPRVVQACREQWWANWAAHGFCMPVRGETVCGTPNLCRCFLWGPAKLNHYRAAPGKEHKIGQLAQFSWHVLTCLAACVRPNAFYTLQYTFTTPQKLPCFI